MRKLKLKIDNKDYILEMNRESIKWLEENGFSSSMEDFGKKPITYCDLLWVSLFRMNHKDITPDLSIKLQDSYSDEKGMAMVNKVIKFAMEEFTAFMNARAVTNSSKNDEKLEIIEA